MKNKFIKNLYQDISFLSTFIWIYFLLLYAIFSVLTLGDFNWIILLISIGLLTILTFFIGFYWIFQTIEINHEGIKVKLLKKVIRDIKWEDVEGMLYGGVMRNPAYIIFVKNSKNLNIDTRKKIKEAIRYYGDDNIKALVEKLKK